MRRILAILLPIVILMMPITVLADPGESEFDDLTPPHVHRMTYTAAVSPTCTKEGNKEYYFCTGCRNYYSDADGSSEITYASTRVPASGHKAVTDEAKAASCTRTGLTEGSHCSVCGEVLVVQTETPALGHKAVADEGKPASCTRTGLTEGSHCSVCKEVLVAQKEIPALGHKASAEWFFDTASHWQICLNNCGTRLNEGSHTFDAGVLTIEATETTEGLKVYTCTVCACEMKQAIPPASHNETVILPAIGHKAETAWTNDKTYHWHACSNGCGTRMDQGAHAFDSGRVTRQPSKTSFGVRTFTCTVCGRTREEQVAKLNPLKLKSSRKTYKVSLLKKKKKTFKIKTSAAEGNIFYTINKAGRKAGIKVSAKGKVTIPKKCKKGTYKITVTASGNENYSSGSKTFVIKIKK